ncbi:MAG: Hsp20/alpha crystallin family protein [Proteobacteria bacterium]|nr:Hsp20/alpha crystallin family protein [Pseudomonadota bacterium]
MFVLARPAAHRAALAPSFGLAFDRLLDQTFDRVYSRSDVRTPAMDVSETDQAYVVAFDLPGASRDELKVSVLGRRVTVETAQDSAQTEPAKADAEPATDTAVVEAAPRALYRERTVTRYARTVSLPAEVDEAHSDAKFENGVLTLTLAKKVPAGATRLAIR